jgi:N-acetylneuraminic acid mutarotase
MRLLHKTIMPLVFILAFFGCHKMEVTSRDYPRLNTLDVTDISESGATFTAEIIFRSSFDIVDFGFVWAQSTNPDLNNADKVIYSSNPASNRFSVDITTTLEPGIMYYVRSFVQTTDYTVYGNTVGFLSLGSMAPEILSFSPSTAAPGDTITISGKNFSYKPKENKVKFGLCESVLISSNDTILKAIVPPALDTRVSFISVEISGNVGRSENQFILSTPIIDHFSPGIGTESTEVTIDGKNFCYIKELNIVKFGDLQATVLEASKNKLRVKVPAGINQSSVFISISVAYQEAVSLTPFTMLSPVIYGFTPDLGYLREKVTITGKYFGSVSQNIQVFFGDISAAISSGCDSLIEVNVPAGLPLEGIKIKVMSYGQIALSSADFHLMAPEISAVNPAKATIGKTVIITGSGFSPQAGDNLVEFNGISATIVANSPGALSVIVPAGINERAVQIKASTGPYQTTTVDFEYVGGYWSNCGPFPGGTRLGAVGFVIGNTYYMGLGVYVTDFQDFWSYDINAQSWTRLADFPGQPRELSVAFAINGKGYIGLGSIHGTFFKDFWEYNPADDSWTQIADFPGSARNQASCIMVNNRCFIGLGQSSNYSDFKKDIYEFDAVSKTWSARSDFPGEARSSAAVFTIGTNAYLGFGQGDAYYNDFWKYISASDSWIKMSDIPAPVRAHTASFSVNGRGYIGLGGSVINHGSYDYDTMMEYDEQNDTWAESISDPYGSGDYPTFFNWNGSVYIIFRAGPNASPATRFEVFTPFN